MVRGWNLGLRLYFLIFLALSSATGVDTASGFSKNGVLGIPYVGNMDIAEVFGGRPSPASAGHAFDEGGGVWGASAPRGRAAEIIFIGVPPLEPQDHT